MPMTENAPKLIHHAGANSNEWEMPKMIHYRCNWKNHNIIVQPEQLVKKISEACPEAWLWKAISGPGAASVGH